MIFKTARLRSSRVLIPTKQTENFLLQDLWDKELNLIMKLRF